MNWQGFSHQPVMADEVLKLLEPVLRKLPKILAQPRRSRNEKPIREVLEPLLEVFVAMELRKQATWAETPVSLHHFRTAAGREVDLVLEDDAGRIVAIEVKASASFGKRDTAGSTAAPASAPAAGSHAPGQSSARCI